MLRRSLFTILLSSLVATAAGAQVQTPGGSPSRRPIQPRPIPIECGEPALGKIHVPGSRRLFSFDGVAGETVDLVMTELRGFPGSFPIAVVTSPGAEELAILIGTELETLLIPESGQYEIEVTASTPGRFSLGLFCQSRGGTPLNCGDLLLDESFGTPGELDYFSFSGQPGDIVQIILAETSGFDGSSPRATLITPTGAALGTFDADNVVPFTLPEAGTYLLRVQANELGGTGTYNIGLGCLPPPGATLLTCGALPASSSTGNPGELVYFTFDGGVDEVIEIVIVGDSRSGMAVPQVRVFTPLGVEVATFTSDSVQLFSLPASGLFTIQVRAATLADTGPFTISVECRDPLGPAVALACGGMASDTLSIGEVDYYTFSGTAGEVAELTLAATAGFPGISAPQMRIITPSGVDLGAFNAETSSVTPILLPETGDYAVRVNSNTLIDAGSYSISLTCLPPTGVVHVGSDSLTSATISAAAEADLYSFDGEAGEVVELVLVQTSGFSGTVARGTLFDPSGMAINTFDANSLTPFTLPDTGSAATGNPYVVEIRAANSVSTGDYNLGLERRQDPSGIAVPEPQSPPLACGQVIPASIDQAGEVDYFRFTGAAGDVVELTLVKTAGFPSSVPNGVVFDPSGVALGSSFNANSLNTFTLPDTGTYSVRVLANTLVHTGSYSLGLSCREPLGPVQAHLVCGDVYPGEISVSGEVDYYTFEGKVGDVVEVTLVKTVGFPSSVPNGVIFGPDGVVLGSSFNANTLNTRTLPETGTYSIRIIANTLVHTGSYNLGLSCREPVGPIVDHLVCGEVFSSEISVSAEVDYYTFDGTAGDVVEITLVKTVGFPSSVPNGVVFGPDGVALGSSFNANSLNTRTLPETGTYSIRIIANTYFHTGSYNLGLSCREPVGPIVDQLVCGEVFSSEISVPAEVDYYTFDGAAGDVVEVTLVKTSGFPSSVPNGVVFGPDGVALGLSFNANSLNTRTLPETGTYSIRIIANTYFHTGSYNIGLSCHAPLGPVVDQLVCGEVFSSEISVPAEVDYYTFDGTAGDVVEITLVKTVGFPSSVPNGVVFGPDGVALGSSFNANTLNTRTLPETGTYSIRIIANTLVHTGSYNLGLSCHAPLGPVVDELVCGEVFSSEISVPAEVDYYTFDGTAGDVVEITLVKTVGFPSSVPNGVVFDADGLALGPSFNANSLNTFTLPETGTYSIRIIANTLVHTGSYNIGLSCRAPVGPVVDHLVCGEVFSSEISVSAEVDYYTFDGTVGEVVEITLVKTGGFPSSVPNGVVFDADGVALGPSFNANSLNTFTLPETGTYSIRIIANTLVHVGSYSLGMSCP